MFVFVFVFFPPPSDSGAAYDDVQVARHLRTEGSGLRSASRRHQARSLLRGLPRPSRHPSGGFQFILHRSDRSLSRSCRSDRTLFPDHADNVDHSPDHADHIDDSRSCGSCRSPSRSCRSYRLFSRTCSSYRSLSRSCRPYRPLESSRRCHQARPLLRVLPRHARHGTPVGWVSRLNAFDRSNGSLYRLYSSHRSSTSSGRHDQARQLIRGLPRPTRNPSGGFHGWMRLTNFIDHCTDAIDHIDRLYHFVVAIGRVRCFGICLAPLDTLRVGIMVGCVLTDHIDHCVENIHHIDRFYPFFHAIRRVRCFGVCFAPFDSRRVGFAVGCI